MTVITALSFRFTLSPARFSTSLQSIILLEYFIDSCFIDAPPAVCGYIFSYSISCCIVINF